LQGQRTHNLKKPLQFHGGQQLFGWYFFREAPANEHRKTRILGEAVVGLRQLTKQESGPFIRFQQTRVPAVATQADR
jgi:hypothetical protein